MSRTIITRGITSRSFHSANSDDDFGKNDPAMVEQANVRDHAIVRTDADRSKAERAQSTLAKPARRK